MYKINLIKEAWKKSFSDRKFVINFIISTFFLAAALTILARFIDYNEEFSGFSFKDPLLNLFNPIDLTWITFIILYSSLVIALYRLSYYPESMLIAFQSYALIAFFRFSTIYFLPLDAPSTIIPLKDPFVEFFGGGRTLYRDLFFSGHTATMFLFFLTSRDKKLRIIFLIASVFVASTVLIQHVHYTIDVLAAPFFAYSSYRIALLLNPGKKIF
jgi:hypothetical protein